MLGLVIISVYVFIATHGRRQTFLLGGQGAGHVGADTSHGRALDGCMDDNWGGGGGSWRGKARALGGSCPPPPPLEPPMLLLIDFGMSVVSNKRILHYYYSQECVPSDPTLARQLMCKCESFVMVQFETEKHTS